MRKHCCVIFLLSILNSAQGYAAETPDKAWEVVMQSAEKGNAFAQWVAGNRYLVDGDYAKALPLFKKSAEQEYTPAQNSLAMMYCNGLGTDKNFTEAVKWLNKCLLAKHKKSIIESVPPELMDMINGRFSRDAEARLATFMIAGEKGNAFAQAMLGLFYKTGMLLPKDSKKSIHWLTKAAEQNFTFAQVALGTEYEDGDGVEPDRDEAIKWYRKAAQQGDPIRVFSFGQSAI